MFEKLIFFSQILFELLFFLLEFHLQICEPKELLVVEPKGRLPRALFLANGTLQTVGPKADELVAEYEVYLLIYYLSCLNMIF
jgi:hypothetical protein